MFLLGVSVQEVLCPGGSLSGGFLSRGLCPVGSLPGGSLSSRGLCPVGVSVQGVSVQLQTPPPGTVKSGRYASYWNAFLFKVFIINLKCTISMKNYHYRKRQFPHFTTNFDADKVRANDIWKPILLWIDSKLSSQLISYNILFHLVESLPLLPKFYLFITVYIWKVAIEGTVECRISKFQEPWESSISIAYLGLLACSSLCKRKFPFHPIRQ